MAEGGGRISRQTGKYGLPERWRPRTAFYVNAMELKMKFLFLDYWSYTVSDIWELSG
jgi:hypothetical protein